MNDPAVFFSDDLNYLVDCLTKNLFQPGSKPFDPRLVIVPCQATKNWLERKWAQNKTLGIAAGVSILEMHAALSIFASKQGKILPSSLELALCLFKEISEIDSSELHQYLQGKNDRLFPLCQKLSALFLEYGVYGIEQLDGWQRELWQRIFGNGSRTYPIELFKSLPPLETRPHLIGFFTLSPAHAKFFKDQGAYFYFHSPCSEYWGDILSDKAHAKKSRFYQKRGVAKAELAELDRLVSEQHPLLANWGGAGRDLLELLETEDMLGDEFYANRETRSRLHQIRNSILQFDTSPCYAIPDDSVQILSIPTRAREIETLLDRLKSLLSQHASDADALKPSDILVLMPDTMKYLPYIQAYFGGGSLPFVITGLEKICTSPLAKAFRDLIGLLEERFDKEALLSVMQSPPFYQKQKWEEGDLTKIAIWIDRAGITWGFDGEQRASITHADLPLDERGTFLFGCDRILFGLVCDEDSPVPAPLPILDWTDADLFGQFVATLENLARDLKETMHPKTLAEWTKWTGEIFTRYFSSQEENWLHISLLRLVRNASCEKLFVFADFCRIVDDILGRRGGQTSNADLQAIRFASLAEGEITEARMIVLLGMQEGAFPRGDSPSSLAKSATERTSSSAIDRYLFLEALMKARDYFWISYVSISPEERIESMPCTIVQEFMAWLKKFFPSSSDPLVEVPALGITQKALNLFPYFSSSRYKAAEFYYGIKPVKTYVKLPSVLPESSWPEADEIRLEDLTQVLRSSPEWYFSQVLRVRLKREEEEDFEPTEFRLPTWTKRKLAWECLTKPSEEVVAKAKFRGEFPMGEFEKVACAELEAEKKDIVSQLEHFRGDPKESYTVVFAKCCTHPKRLEDGTLILPAWKIAIENRHFFVTGQIDKVVPQGLLCEVKDKPAELFPYLPQMLALSANNLASALLPFKKENKKEELFTWPCNPEEEMRKLILYAEKAKKLVSPFKAKLAVEFFDSFDKWEKKMSEEKDRYSAWLIEEQEPEFVKALFGLWQPYLKESFGTFFSIDDDDV